MIEFGVGVLRFKTDMDKSFESNHLYQQLFRSATAVPLNYAEAIGGESKKDFVHKLSICLKELRESHVNLKMIDLGGLHNNKKDILKLLDEANQMIAMLIKSINTTKEKYPESFK